MTIKIIGSSKNKHAVLNQLQKGGNKIQIQLIANVIRFALVKMRVPNLDKICNNACFVTK